MARTGQRRKLLGGGQFAYNPDTFQRPIMYGQGDSQHARLLEEQRRRGAEEAALENARQAAARARTKGTAAGDEPQEVISQTANEIRGPESLTLRPLSPLPQILPTPGDDSVPAGYGYEIPEGVKGSEQNPYLGPETRDPNTGGFMPYPGDRTGVAFENGVKGSEQMLGTPRRLFSGNVEDTRPRVVENAPVREDVPRTEAQRGYEEAGGVPYEFYSPNQGTDSSVDTARKKKLFSGMRASSDVSRDIEATYGELPAKGPKGENREKSFAKRLFSGIWDSVQTWREQGAPGGLEGLLGTVIFGGGASAASPKYYEGVKRERQRGRLFGELGRAREREAYETTQAKAQAGVADTYSGIVRRAAQSANEATDNAYKANKEEWDALKFVYQQSDEFNPDDAKNSVLVARMKKAGFPIFFKKQGDQWNIAPNGQMYNSKTGQVVEGSNFSKPPTIANAGLPDSLVGLEDDSAIVTRAKASVGKGPEGRRVKPDVLANLPSAYKNADGSFNEAKFWSDKAMGITDLNASDIYEGLPSDYEQRLAAETSKLQGQQKPLREEWAKFKFAITNQKPPSAPEYQANPLQLVELFKQVMAIRDAKQRAAKLADMYDTISKTRLN